MTKADPDGVLTSCVMMCHVGSIVFQEETQFFENVTACGFGALAGPVLVLLLLLLLLANPTITDNHR